MNGLCYFIKSYCYYFVLIVQMINLENIEKYYSNGGVKNYVLRHVTTRIESGEFVSIMGPSGAGKSTLLHLLGMLDSATSGKYNFMGSEVSTLSEKQQITRYRDHIGFVFQAYHLMDELTVYENIEAPLIYKKIPSSVRRSKIADVLDRFQMVAKKDLFPAQLSGGQQQLVGIARALVTDPTLILADEPTGNLHSTQAMQIMEWFKELNEKDKITIVQVTHSEQNARYGKRILELNDGLIRKDTLIQASSSL